MSNDPLELPSGQVADRRQEGRTISVLRVCCVETSQGTSFALLRNISPSGAQIEADLPDPIGAPVCYFFDDEMRIQALIAWKHDGRIGLANREIAETNIKSFPRRSLRVPLSAPGKVWANGNEVVAEVANISQTGAQIIGNFDLPTGALISVEIGKLVLPNVTVRWSANNYVGVKFERPLHLRELKTIVEGCKQLAGKQTSSASPQGSHLRSA
jgi:hypothetical protein